MIEYREGVTDFDHLIDTIIKHTPIRIHRVECYTMVRRHLEKCVEVYKDGVLAGYALIIDLWGWRTFHGYKLIPGNSISAFRVAKDILKNEGNVSITTTKDRVQVIRLARLLGLTESKLIGGTICLSR